MKKTVLDVALRNNAVYIPFYGKINNGTSLDESTSLLLSNCMELGYTFSEELLQTLSLSTPVVKSGLFAALKELTGVDKNWTPLVKQWDRPTDETIFDHMSTWFANLFNTGKGTRLPCGHLIPENTFPLERYNGCPFCGTPFEFERLDYKAHKGKLVTLTLWKEKDARKYMRDLLESPVALDATQFDSLKILLAYFGLSDKVAIQMKETLMLVIDCLVENGKEGQAGSLFSTPTDVLRYLWFKHTGFLQLIEPKTIVKRMAKNSGNMHWPLDNRTEAKIKSITELKLKYTRTECRRYARWLNSLTINVESQCENMHPKRAMWVRVIRALRLAEYSKKEGFENLAKMLDVFYNQSYNVWLGDVNRYKLKSDPENTFRLLKQRPGYFARALFSSMLWFGPETTLSHFKEVMDEVQPRLIFTLNMYAEIYFNKSASRMVKPLGGVNKRIPVNALLALYSEADLKRMQRLVTDLTKERIHVKLANVPNDNRTIYIAEELYNVPVAVGDRSEQIQDKAAALMGTRFKVEGDTVRLFMQWGNDLPAQHLDMDLSCKVAYDDHVDSCSYLQLAIPGCKHSGDIQRIPNYVGTAEYINLDLKELQESGARYISFTCNAYTNGSIAPNLELGWMNSKDAMAISSYGVAYNPSCVQHKVRIKDGLAKGLLFGVLDVLKREIIWMEMSFNGQLVGNLSVKNVEALLTKLDAKLKIGDLLYTKAEAQNLELVDNPESADEKYDLHWALNTAEVSKLFL